MENDIDCLETSVRGRAQNKFGNMLCDTYYGAYKPIMVAVIINSGCIKSNKVHPKDLATLHIYLTL